MTVQLTISATAYPGDGAQTAFSIPFEAADASYIKVYVNDVLVTIGYVISGSVLVPGAVVLFGVPPPAGSTVKILRSTPQLQNTIYTTYGPYKAKQVEADFDRMVMMIQEQQYAIEHPPPVALPPTPTAGQISFAPTGGISATNVQSALVETDQEWRAADLLQVPRATILQSADTDTLIVAPGNFSGSSVTFATRANVPRGLLKLDSSGKVPTDLLQTIGLRFLGIWGPIVNGSVPPVSGTQGDYYLFDADGGMTLLTSANPTPHSVSVVLNDQMIYDTSTVPGWYYVHTSQPATIAAVNVSFAPVGSIVSSNVQAAITELDADISDRFHESGSESVIERFNGLGKEAVLISSANGVRLLRNSQDKLATHQFGAYVYGDVPSTNPNQATSVNFMSSDGVQQAYLQIADVFNIYAQRAGMAIRLGVYGGGTVPQTVLTGQADGQTQLFNAGNLRLALYDDGLSIAGRDPSSRAQRCLVQFSSVDGVLQARLGFLDSTGYYIDVVRPGAFFQVQFPNGTYFNIDPNTANTFLSTNLTVGGQVAVNTSAPLSANHLTRKDYVDSRLQGFTSADFILVSTAVPHNLGQVPSECSAYLVNFSTQYGYVPGDLVALPRLQSVGGSFLGFDFGADANNIWFSAINPGPAMPYIIPKSGGVPAPITQASWRVRLFARR